MSSLAIRTQADKFKLKYSNSEVKKYYTKFDVGIEIAMQQE
jgi:hypothetical protein